jgi:hypothetical protein
MAKGSVPELPVFYARQFTDKNGYMMPDTLSYMDNTFQTLNIIVNFFNKGVEMPRKTTAEIATLAPDKPGGTVWFNTDTQKLQVKVDSGSIETIASS